MHTKIIEFKAGTMDIKIKHGIWIEAYDNSVGFENITSFIFCNLDELVEASKAGKTFKVTVEVEK